MQVAIASTDGVNVNEHFGRAQRFFIYEVSENGLPVHCRTMVVECLSTGDKEHGFDPERFAAIANCLQGCTRVYVEKIGERPADELKKIGIEPVMYDGLISALRE